MLIHAKSTIWKEALSALSPIFKEFTYKSSWNSQYLKAISQ